ncbi:MAG: DUF3881 family protein [Lachnospiraceae bacterium]|nr:DUF3881 family protein [Lachnospiraceae bacterium]
MHKYLRAIGFSKINKKSELKKILNEVLKNPDKKQYATVSDESVAVEYTKEFAESLGIVVSGEYTDEVEFEYEYFYPYFLGSNISSIEDIEVEKRYDREEYAGICDDLKVGITTIFYLQNRLDYLKFKNLYKKNIPSTSVNLSALSVEGSIMLPLSKNPDDEEKNEKKSKNRIEKMKAAMEGDEQAMEDLSIADIDTYSSIQRMILTEDVYSLVDTYFMPYGIEFDHYSVLGEICAVEKRKNKLTNEKLYIITIKCNDLVFDVCINAKDLVGEPEVNRRFKGIVWMQGHINFGK